jgi:DNA-binding NarL/FixJ family response regulator
MGCVGLVSRDFTAEQAFRALSAVLDGELWLSRKTSSQTLLKLIREAKYHLTSRESQILSLLGEGLKNHEIAERLFISPQTVRWHLRSLYTKLGTHDRNSAASGSPAS